jgi:hypothetical protein
MWKCYTALALAFSVSAFAERINHAGRILGPLPNVTNAVQFHTPQADAIVSALQIFPPTSAWNEDISRRPVHTNSAAIIAQVIVDAGPSPPRRDRFYPNPVETFVVVPSNQPLVTIQFFEFADESDPGPYPIPPNMPIQDWPLFTGSLTLEQWQRNVNNVEGLDRRAIIIQPASDGLWEMYNVRLTNTTWRADLGAKFNFASNDVQRPSDWTAATASGMPLLPGVVRFDELARGEVEHALYMTVPRVRGTIPGASNGVFYGWIYPATTGGPNTANNTTNLNRPRYGERFRLKESFSIPGHWTIAEKAVARAMKKYGAIIADQGTGGFFEVVCDPRLSNAFPNFTSSLATNLLSITNFEVIQTTGTNEGPRSPGAPTVDAGPDRQALAGFSIPLEATVTYTNAAPLVVLWQKYSGPGNVTFGMASNAITSASFDAPGTYILLVSANDGIHAVAYDAINVAVSPAVILDIQRSGPNALVSWRGHSLSDTVILEKALSLPAVSWLPVKTNGSNATVPISPAPEFFRVRKP